MSPKRRPTPLTPGERAAQQIREFHKLGILVLARAETDQLSILVAGQLLASEVGVSADRARKAARFAKRFDEKSLARLDKLCETYPLTVNHIRRVLWVKSKTASQQWLKRAADGHWRSDRLRSEIQASTGDKRGSGGPQIRIPADPIQAIEQIDHRTEDWLKRYEAGWDDDVTWSGVTDITDQAELLRRLSESRRMLKRLLTCSEALEGRLVKLERAAKRRSKKSEIVRSPGARS